MPMETLENLRMLSNLETATEKLVQIVLIGQPEFDEMLNRHELRQLKQRLAIRTVISPLTHEESIRYIEHRLSKVVTKDEPIFSKGALKEIVRLSKGIPRVINILCDNALITGYGYQKKPVTAKIINEIAVDFEDRKKEKEPQFFGWKAAAVLVLVIGAAALFLTSPYRGQVWEQLEGWVGSSTEAMPPVRMEVKSMPPLPQAPGRSAPATHAPATPAPPPIANQEPAEATVAARAEEPARPETAAAHMPDRSVKPATMVSKPEAQAPGAKVVEKGDTLSRLIVQNYGAYDREMLQKVKNLNPGIKDVNKIYIGDTIVFPDTDRPDDNKKRR
jgi:general secretion pathway protein A